MGNITNMGIGVGILLIVVGGFLTFALDTTLAGLDLKVVGWVLMLGGLVGLVLFFYFWNRSRAPAVTTERAPVVMTESPSMTTPRNMADDLEGSVRHGGNGHTLRTIDPLDGKQD